MREKIFIILGYQNFTDYFIGLSKILRKKYKIICLVYGHKNFLKVQKNKEYFDEIYSYEKLIDSFYQNINAVNFNELENFENKYGNLWKTIYADRQFLDYFYKINYGKKKLSYSHLISFTYQWIDFFEKIFSNKKYKYLISYSTASMPGLLAVKIAKKHNTKYLCYKTLGIPDRFTLVDDLTDEFLIPETKTINQNWAEDYIHKFRLETISKPNWINTKSRKNFIKRLTIILNNISEEKSVFSFIDNEKTPYINLSLRTIISEKLKKIYNNIYFKYFLKNKNYDLNDRYIFFPFHVEPESKLMVKNILNTDQISLLENLSKVCPINMKIIAKDHPNQPVRSKEFYKRIQNIPNVIFIKDNLNSKELIKKSQLVICISGTVIMESLLMKKKILVFGNNIIIKNFFPEFKISFANIEDKFKENILIDELKIVKMMTYLKDISTNITSKILISLNETDEISKKLFELFERVDAKTE